MSFERVRDDLQALENKLSLDLPITAEDVFHTIRDLCEDVKSDTGSPVEQKPAGDAASLLRQLPWMGRLVSRQYRRIEGQVMDMGRQEELDKKIRELDDLADKMEILAGETAVLDQKHKQLLAQQALLESQSEQKLNLQNACQTLENQIRQLSQVTVPQLQDRQVRLQLECEQIASKCRQTRKDLEAAQTQEQEASEELSRLNTALRQSRQQYETCRADSQKAGQEQQRLEQALSDARQQLSQVQSQTEDTRAAWQLCSQEQLPQAQELLQTQRGARDEALVQLQQLRQETARLKADTESMNQEREQLHIQQVRSGEQLEKLRRDKQEKLRQLDQLRQALGQFDNECAQLQQQLDQLRDDLSGKDRERMKQNLQDAIARQEQALNEYHELQIRIQEQQRTAQEQARKNQAAQEQQQELKWQAERDNEKAAERIAQLQRQILQLREHADQLQAEETALKKQAEQLESWLRGLELEQYTQRLEQMRQRNQELMQAKTALQEDMQRLLAAGGGSAGELDVSLFQADFRNIENWILYYQKLFADTVKKLSSKDTL